MDSNKTYGKVDQQDQMPEDVRRRKQKRIAVIFVSSLVLVLVVVSALIGTSLGKDDRSKSLSSSIKTVCNMTLYPETCYNSLYSLANPSHVSPLDLFKLSVQVAINELSNTSKYFHGNELQTKGVNTSNDMILTAFKSCNEFLGLALDHLNDSFSATNVDLKLIESRLDDLITWLSASGTFQQTCIDGFENLTGENEMKQNVFRYLRKSTELTSNSLAIVKGIFRVSKPYKHQRRLMSSLLQKTNLPAGIKADVTVAQDGSGKYKKIGHALKVVPDNSEERFVIYVKKGIYYENVRVEKTKWNVMMVGDGMNLTTVSGSLNFVDGTQTFSSATFAVFGKGFIARDMGFRNTAGANKNQAVALMSTADQSVFYKCRMDGFQDTLYTHSNRQFYRECNIYGTVDFIFGNSAVVFQKCNILPKRPKPGQQNTITAQGKFDPNQNTGISIQDCTIWPSGDLSSVQTFLGRPWRKYSTTVYFNNVMGSLIDPKGWLSWGGANAPRTIFYGEFANIGPGSSTKGRVKWKGLRYITSKQARKFTVNSFINRDKWIAATGVVYKPGL